MQNYMLTIVVKNELDEKARGALLDEVKKQFGSLKKEDLWGARSLAYPIMHQDRAYFAHFEFESEPANISSLDKMIKLNEDIIRYLLTRVDLPKKVVKPRTEVSRFDATKKQAAKVESKEEEMEERAQKDGDTKLE